MWKNKTTLPKLLTIRQASEILNVRMETLRRWDKSGKLKAIKVNDRGDRRYDPKEKRAQEEVVKMKGKHEGSVEWWEKLTMRRGPDSEITMSWIYEEFNPNS